MLPKKCDIASECPFYNGKLKMDGGLFSMMKRKYCVGSFRNCARYMINSSLGSERVPYDLYPSMTDDAKKIIADSISPE